MNGNFIILTVLFAYLRKALNSRAKHPEWDRIIVMGLGIAIVCLMLQVFFPPVRVITNWVAHAQFAGFLWLAYKHPVFQPVRSWAVALLPLEAVDLTSDVVKLISPQFYSEWKSYFETAALFAVVWLVAMLIIGNKQRKALALERKKAEEKEKEFKLAEEMKAILEEQVAERTAALQGQKQELEKTLNELKATQTQLIQSEKMASLGELTAGIAHEIQNPLNFVNNFSEVSKELLEEMKHALANGNASEAEALAADVIQNLEKINFHGKRADGIVKGMLQHSRSSTGQKEPTDINALCDEYLRLAYHGLRAKEKSFNAKFETDLDPAVGMVQVMPQEMGRVVLNLINNAFYAVSQKKQIQKAGYEPLVAVRTKRVGEWVEIRVVDNGSGIPDSVKGKIFQPFFTTKPTGQGTGLGLSLTYDIITKGHGGTLSVETKEGVGSEFIIQLPIV